MSTRREPMLGALILAGLLACISAAAAWGAWPTGPGGVALGRSDWDPQRYTVVCPDGSGGAIVAWMETFWINPERTEVSEDIRVQRVDRDGVELWGAYGVDLNPDYSWYQRSPQIVEDGAGGAFVAWFADERDGSGIAVALQRLDAAGAEVWADPLELGPYADSPFTLCADGAGGAIVAWVGYESGFRIRAQRIASNGTFLWPPEGVPLSLVYPTTSGIRPVSCGDGAGGAYVAWIPGNTLNQVWAQHVDGAGSLRWGNGYTICSAAGQRSDPTICPDGAGGAVIAWWDGRRGSSTDWDLYGQRVNDVQYAWWGANGLLLRQGGSRYSPPRAAQEPSGGALVAWGNVVQRVDGEGNLGFGAGGVTLGTGVVASSIVGDGSGGAIIASTRTSGSDKQVMGHRVDASGTLYGPAGGIPVSTTSTYPRVDATVCDDGRGSAIVAYCRGNDVGYGTVYTSTAHRIDRFGYVGDPQPRMNAAYDLFGDEGGAIGVSWFRSYLDTGPGSAIGAYWVWRQVPASEALSAVSAGARWIDDSGPTLTGLGPGLEAAVEDGLYLRTGDGANSLYWEYTGSVPSTGAASYLDTVATPATRAPGFEPGTIVMIQARAATGTGHWESWPDTAVAVDNIGPSAPSPFTGSYASGATSLQWGPHSAPDFAMFRLYRGKAADFVPGPGNQVTETTQTSWVDPAGEPYYYKLTGVDVHGTEGPAALLLPDGTVGAPGEAPVTVLALAPVAPNPVRIGANVCFDLPQACVIDLALFDVGGRRVRSLAAGAVPAGRHVLRWDARDEAGEPVPGGIYFVRLRAAVGEVACKLVVAH